jgi:hypothetical protein
MSPMMLVALVLIIIAVVGMWIGMRRQRAALAAATEPLMRAGRVSAPKPAIGTLPNLPPAVERYLRLAIRASKEIQHVRITWLRVTERHKIDGRSARETSRRS